MRTMTSNQEEKMNSSAGHLAISFKPQGKSLWAGKGRLCRVVGRPAVMSFADSQGLTRSRIPERWHSQLNPAYQNPGAQYEAVNKTAKRSCMLICMEHRHLEEWWRARPDDDRNAAKAQLHQ